MLDQSTVLLVRRMSKGIMYGEAMKEAEGYWKDLFLV